MAPFALGEIVHGPDGIALHLVAAGERKEVERPLVAVNLLRPRTRSDRDQLREMKLERRRML